MNATFQKYATPLTTGFFFISLISGTALFFHLGTQYFREMHEWLSLVLILPFVLHLWKNWRAFLTYFKRPTMAIALGFSLAAALAFVIPAATSGSGGGNPMFGVVQAVENATLSTAAPLFGKDAATLTSDLTAAGFKITAPDQTLSDIAKASGKDNMELISILVAVKK